MGKLFTGSSRITAEIAEGAEFKTRAFQSTLGFPDASAFSAHSAVKYDSARE